MAGPEPDINTKKNALMDGIRRRYDFDCAAIDTLLVNFLTLSEFKHISFEDMVNTIATTMESQKHDSRRLPSTKQNKDVQENPKMLKTKKAKILESTDGDSSDERQTQGKPTGNFQPGRRPSNDNPGGFGRDIVCDRCKKPGHIARDCRSRFDKYSNHLPKRGYGNNYKGRGGGHFNKYRPGNYRYNKYDNKGGRKERYGYPQKRDSTIHIQVTKLSQEEDVTTSRVLVTKPESEQVVVHDSGAEVTVFQSTPRVMSDVVQTNKTIVHGNNQKTVVNQMGTIGEFTDVLVSRSVTDNIFSTSRAADLGYVSVFAQNNVYILKPDTHLNFRREDIACIGEREGGLYLTKLPDMLKMMSATTHEKEGGGGSDRRGKKRPRFRRNDSDQE